MPKGRNRAATAGSPRRPSTELAGVELLGHPALELNGTLDEHGLAVSGLPAGCLPAGIAHVAVLKLRYDA